ncbi:MAG TPA: exodeoxyribonuclease VII small subunit [Thermomicrobiales bacterium]|nr:exodeoxyribonuclease VII small subunit [Thermomicrobiales bacterium]
MNVIEGSPPSLETIRALAEDGAFEENIAALELVVEHLERGRLTMDESIAWYEAGLGLMRRCSQLLEQAELRISALDAGNSVRAGSGRKTSSDDSWHADAS